MDRRGEPHLASTELELERLPPFCWDRVRAAKSATRSGNRHSTDSPKPSKPAKIRSASSSAGSDQPRFDAVTARSIRHARLSTPWSVGRPARDGIQTVVVRLYDGRVMPLECKVSNSAVNSFKRINHEAAGKARDWIAGFGQRQVVPAAVLAGVFNPLNLATAQHEGLTVYWNDRLADLVRLLQRRALIIRRPLDLGSQDTTAARVAPTRRRKPVAASPGSTGSCRTRSPRDPHRRRRAR